MTPRSPAATEVARRLWASSVGDSSAPEDVAAAADRMFTGLRAGLGRWVGTMGYRALLDRALVVARAEHPALGSLATQDGDESVTTAAVRAHSAAELAAGMVALVAALVDLLGRILGEEMAVRLVEQTDTRVEQTGIKKERERPSPRGVVSTESRGGRDAGVG